MIYPPLCIFFLFSLLSITRFSVVLKGGKLVLIYLTEITGSVFFNHMIIFTNIAWSDDKCDSNKTFCVCRVAWPGSVGRPLPINDHESYTEGRFFSVYLLKVDFYHCHSVSRGMSISIAE